MVFDLVVVCFLFLSVSVLHLHLSFVYFNSTRLDTNGNKMAMDCCNLVAVLRKPSTSSSSSSSSSPVVVVFLVPSSVDPRFKLDESCVRDFLLQQYANAAVASWSLKVPNIFSTTAVFAWPQAFPLDPLAKTSDCTAAVNLSHPIFNCSSAPYLHVLPLYFSSVNVPFGMFLVPSHVSPSSQKQP